MAKTLGIIAIKGGVGKTTIAASLASSLVNHFGKKVLLVDTNFSAPNLGLHMDILAPTKTIHHVLDRKISISQAIHIKFGVDVIPGDYIYNQELNHLKLKDKLKTIKKDYDFIVLDSSPSMNSELLSTMLASDLLFVVTTPDYPTLSCSLKAAKLAKQRGRPIAGLIINKVRDPEYELTLKELESATELPVVAKIPDDKLVLRSTFTRIPTSIYHRYSKFSNEISNLCSTISQENKRPPLIKRLFPFTMKKEEVNRQILKKSFYDNTFDNIFQNEES
jgi:MinD-like ATPase involved in chromosome partitioning or flagellar assembly